MYIYRNCICVNDTAEKSNTQIHCTYIRNMYTHSLVQFSHSNFVLVPLRNKFKMNAAFETIPRGLHFLGSVHSTKHIHIYTYIYIIKYKLFCMN